MYFSETFLSILIVAAILGIAVSAVTLIILVIKDIKTNKLW